VAMVRLRRYDDGLLDKDQGIVAIRTAREYWCFPTRHTLAGLDPRTRMLSSPSTGHLVDRRLGHVDCGSRCPLA
jgi:hypothetical protein